MPDPPLDIDHGPSQPPPFVPVLLEQLGVVTVYHGEGEPDPEQLVAEAALLDPPLEDEHAPADDA